MIDSPVNNESPIVPPSLTFQEKVLGGGMLYGTKTVTDYKLDGNGVRLNPHSLNQHEFNALTQEFRHDPFTRLAYVRENLRDIMGDEKIPLEQRKDRARRYVDAYSTLTVKLDRKAFPPDETTVHNGIPEYIPDGLSDMGSDSAIDPTSRFREKIRIDKAKVFKKAKPLFNEIFSMQFSKNVTREQWKKYVTLKVAHFVYTSMPYNKLGRMHNAFGARSVRLDEIEEQQISECRHHALMSQVLLQAFGITSRLMKSDLEIDGRRLGAHANNIVRIEGQWYLLDSTNPERKPDGTSELYLKPIPEKTIDLNTNQYVWELKGANGENRTYTSRSNMFYRIMDNVRNPTK